MERANGVTAHRDEIGWLYQAGLLIFVVTVTIGIANGTRVFGTLDRATLLTHVHAGTLGWITIGVLATALWVFGARGSSARARPLALLTIVAVPVYVAAFFSGNLPARAVFGTLMLVTVLLIFLWALGQARAIGWRPLSTPQLGLTFGLATFVVGSTIGTYIQVQLASGANPASTGDLVGAHATAQVIGYLVLAAVAIGEWKLRPAQATRGRAATAQILLLFVGGLVFALAVLLNVPPLLGIANLLQLIAIAIFVVRVAGPVVATPWAVAGPRRHFAIAVPFLVVNIGLTVYLVSLVVGGKPFNEIPFGVVIALDHAMFVGVMTNVLFGLIDEFTADRRSILPWADHVVFWGMNVGVAAFIAVLVLDLRDLSASRRR